MPGSDVTVSGDAIVPAPVPRGGNATAVAGAESSPTEQSAAPRAPRTSSPRTRALWCVGGIAVAVVLAVVATTVLTDVTATVRVGLGLLAAVVAFMSVDRLCKTVISPTFETGVWLAVLWLVVLVLAAVLVDLLPIREARDVSLTLDEATLQRPDLFSAHPLGTDRQGLDILGGVMYGARVSLVVALGAVLIGMVVGGIIGVAAGFYRGRIEAVVGVLTDSMLAFPPLILLLAIVAVVSPTVGTVALALAVISIPTYIRIARANTLVFAQRDFVLAARALGARNRTVILREIVPNVALPVVSFGFTVVAVLIVAEASLSFLGLSIQRPDPSWGNMIAAGQRDFDRHPHLVFVPSLVLFLTVFALNRVGDKARRLWDPRESRL